MCGEYKEYTKGVITMKKKILAIVTILSLAIASTAFARGYDHGRHGGYSHGYRHGHDGLGIALGVAGGLILGSVLLSPPPPPPREVVYVPQYPAYQPPRVCLEERLVSGEFQVNRYDGRRIWVPFQYPVTRQVQVPCY